MGCQDSRLAALKAEVNSRAVDLGISQNEITFLDEATSSCGYDRLKPALGIYFGNQKKTVPALLGQLIKDSIVIVPVVTNKTQVEVEIPSELLHVNVIEVGMNSDNVFRLVSLVFETFRLLRKERGIFISYRRKGSQPLANRLYEELDSRGFDVFIDIRSVPPAVDFQAELWHRMSDVDTILLIDTPGFREGRWTKAELAQANLLGIQTLHLLWPGQIEDSDFAFSHYFKLIDKDFGGLSPGRGATIKANVVDSICDLAEALRAKAMAFRHAHLVDNFCDAVREKNFVPTVQPQRWISVELEDGSTLAVVPAVGRPTSERINVIFEAISTHTNAGTKIWAIYDSRGIHNNWIKHLRWLDGHLPIKTVSVGDLASSINGMLT
jgi:hypothetical protein